jgi:hypothetical protein
MLFVIRQDAHAAVHDKSVTRAERLVDEAYELGCTESRKALGQVWSAVLKGIPASFWKNLRFDAPEVHAELCEFLGVKNG